MKNKNEELKAILDEISDIFVYAYDSSEDEEICKVENKLHDFLRKEGYDI
jgi:hypothetical protein